MKQRVVGGLVLLALGVLFLPLLFETDARRTLDKTSQIPPPPDIQPMVVEAPVRSAEVRQARPAGQQYQLLDEDERAAAETSSPPAVATPAPAAEADAAPLVTRPETPARQLLGENGMPAAWFVQVASFGAEDRANALRDQLQQQGFPALTRTFESNGAMMTRVFVGPKISRDQALELKGRLDESLKINTLVVSFSP